MNIEKEKEPPNTVGMAFAVRLQTRSAGQDCRALGRASSGGLRPQGSLGSESLSLCHASYRFVVNAKLFVAAVDFSGTQCFGISLG